MANRKTHKEVADLAIVGGPTEDGQGAQLLRIRDGRVSTGEIRPVREGQPITSSELVRLRPLDATQRICEVEVLHSANMPATNRSAADKSATDEQRATTGNDRTRPARVSNDRFRRNWDTVFDTRRKQRGKPDLSLN